MRILDLGYQIVAWIDRRPAKPSVKPETLEKLGFYFADGEWRYPDISDPQVAKSKFIELSHSILELSSFNK